MKKFAYLVSENYDELMLAARSFVNEYSLLDPVFRLKNCELEKVIWTSPFDIPSFDGMIPKNIWNYFDRPDALRRLLVDIEKTKTPLINSVPNVRWNMDKNYLKDIQHLDLNVLDFKVIPKNIPFHELSESLFPLARQILLKPTISGGSKKTFLINRDDHVRVTECARAILLESDLMVQPFYKEVTQGELSFFFFGGEFSHSIIKIPKSGDFRAHSFFGATNKAYQPKSDEIRETKRYLNASPEPPAYARVDLLKVGSSLSLVELELIEPYLYFEHSGDKNRALELFTEAVLSAGERERNSRDSFESSPCRDPFS